MVSYLIPTFSLSDDCIIISTISLIFSSTYATDEIKSSLASFFDVIDDFPICQSTEQCLETFYPFVSP